MSAPTPESLAIANTCWLDTIAKHELARRIDAYVAERTAGLSEELVVLRHKDVGHTIARMALRAAADAMAEILENTLNSATYPSQNMKSRLASYRALTKGEPTSIHTPDLEAGND